ncbi:unnamed protein product [Ixodes persulcatus]
MWGRHPSDATRPPIAHTHTYATGHRDTRPEASETVSYFATSLPETSAAQAARCTSAIYHTTWRSLVGPLPSDKLDNYACLIILASTPKESANTRRMSGQTSHLDAVAEWSGRKYGQWE